MSDNDLPYPYRDEILEPFKPIGYITPVGVVFLIFLGLWTQSFFAFLFIVIFGGIYTSDAQKKINDKNKKSWEAEYRRLELAAARKDPLLFSYKANHLSEDVMEAYNAKNPVKFAEILEKKSNSAANSVHFSKIVNDDDAAKLLSYLQTLSPIIEKYESFLKDNQGINLSIQEKLEHKIHIDLPPYPSDSMALNIAKEMQKAYIPLINIGNQAINSTGGVIDYAKNHPVFLVTAALVMWIKHEKHKEKAMQTLIQTKMEVEIFCEKMEALVKILKERNDAIQEYRKQTVAREKLLESSLADAENDPYSEEKICAVLENGFYLKMMANNIKI